MRRLLMILITDLICLTLHAQSPTLGLKGGSNVASLVSKNGGNAGTKFAYNAGIFSRIGFTNKLLIKMEALYSRQGIRQSLSGNNYNINLNYINVPLLIQLLVKPGLCLETGPQFGYLLSAKNIYQGVKKDIKSNYRSFDISLPIGVSFLFSSRLGIEGRWVPGLSTVNITYGAERNSVFQLGAFYQITKQKKYLQK